MKAEQRAQSLLLLCYQGVCEGAEQRLGPRRTIDWKARIAICNLLMLHPSSEGELDIKESSKDRSPISNVFNPQMNVKQEQKQGYSLFPFQSGSDLPPSLSFKAIPSFRASHWISSLPLASLVIFVVFPVPIITPKFFFNNLRFLFLRHHYAIHLEEMVFLLLDFTKVLHGI